MELSTAIELIKNDQLSQQTTTWADLGCGSGLFTFALANLLQPGSTIYAIDKSPVRLDSSLPANGVEIKTLQLDFITKKLPLKQLDGILMANSLHYVRDKTVLIQQLAECLQPDGQFLMVEYDTDTPVSQWVPFPISFRSLQKLFPDASVEHLGEHPSVYGRANMYAALISR